MPNHCENDLEVEGPRAEVERFLEHAKGENGVFDFNRFLPYPERYAALDAEAARWRERSDVAMALKWQVGPKDGFNSGGHDWCVKNWGTKWNAYRIGPVEVQTFEGGASAALSFETAWSPPSPVVKKASEMFPELEFTLRYFERGMEFNGIYHCKGGEVLRDETGPYFGTRGG